MGQLIRVVSAQTASALAVLLALAVNAVAAETAKPAAAAAGGAAVIKVTPGTTFAALAGRPDSDLVELANGQRMRVGELRRLSQWGKRARTTPRRTFAPALRARPAATGRRIADSADLAEALKRPDSENVMLPSGRVATVGQIKLLMPQVEKRLGRRFVASKRPNLSGPAIKVSAATSRDEWKRILRKPDSTVLEAPDGKRVTVEMIKETLRASRPSRRPQPSAPARR